jgi:hypothetical protein
VGEISSGADLVPGAVLPPKGNNSACSCLSTAQGQWCLLADMLEAPAAWLYFGHSTLGPEPSSPLAPGTWQKQAYDTWQCRA